MALDLSAGSLIRSGSGLLFVTLGVVLAFIARRGVGETKLAVGLAVHCVGFGSAFIATNLGARDPTLAPAFVTVTAVGWTVAFAGLLWALFGLRPTLRRGLAYAGVLVAALIVALVYWSNVARAVAISVAVPPSAVDSFAFSFVPTWPTMALGFLVVGDLAARASPDRGSRASILLAIGLVLYPSYITGETAGDLALAPRMDPTVAALMVMLGALLLWAVATWIAAIERIGRTARMVPLVGLSSALVGMLTPLVLGADDRGLVGVLRICAVVALAVAILRHDVLGAKLHVRLVRRGTVATGALAALFIVAQIAENFLDAQYGLLTGGVVAGAFLFAASPIQRAVERLGAGPAATTTPSPARPNDFVENERVYKLALRRFLADGTITGDEEVALGHLADELRITTRRAIELRHEVERELGRRA